MCVPRVDVVRISVASLVDKDDFNYFANFDGIRVGDRVVAGIESISCRIIERGGAGIVWISGLICISVCDRGYSGLAVEIDVDKIRSCVWCRVVCGVQRLSGPDRDVLVRFSRSR